MVNSRWKMAWIGTISIATSILFFQNCGDSGFKAQTDLLVLSSNGGAQSENPSNGWTIPVPLVNSAADSLVLGDFMTMADGKTQGLNITGKSILIRGKDGKTTVYTTAFGLGANQMYMSHIHNKECAAGAGTHYKFDSTITDALETNEIWPMIQTDGEGVGRAAIQLDKIAGAEAVSVVIHGATGVKIACADLKAPQVPIVFSGSKTFSMTQTNTTISGNILGIARVRTNGRSEFQISINHPGLAGTSPSFFIGGACTSGAGGGATPYLIDPAGAATADNQIRATVTVNSKGFGATDWVIEHSLRLTSDLSLNTESGGGVCIPLPSGSTGNFAPIAQDETNGLIVTGTSHLNHLLDGTTALSIIYVRNESIPVQLRLSDRPCALNGGDPYLLVPSQGATSSNQIILSVLATDPLSGQFNISLPQAVRSDAMSVVAYLPTSHLKISCQDLF